MDVGTAKEQNQDGNTNEASELRSFCENGFEGDIAASALVLGRPEEEINRMLDGIEPIDEDLVMKLRGIAEERGIDIGS